MSEGRKCVPAHPLRHASAQQMPAAESSGFLNPPPPLTSEPNLNTTEHTAALYVELLLNADTEVRGRQCRRAHTHMLGAARRRQLADGKRKHPADMAMLCCTMKVDVHVGVCVRWYLVSTVSQMQAVAKDV